MSGMVLVYKVELTNHERSFTMKPVWVALDADVSDSDFLRLLIKGAHRALVDQHGQTVEEVSKYLVPSRIELSAISALERG